MTDLEACTALRPDFAVATAPHESPGYELIGATWTTNGEPRAQYVVVPADASAEERERQTATLLDYCRRWIEAGDVLTLDINQNESL
jgi:hypothetical protein